MKSLLVFICIISGVSIPSTAQDSFPNTIPFAADTGSAEAEIEIIDFLAGHWRGEAFGGIIEEVWTPPLGNSMMCVFKLIMNDQVSFYEIVTITEEKGSLILRLKHFNPLLKGWEEKDETVDFRFVKAEGNRFYFDEFTFEKISPDEINIYVVIESNGNKEEVKFNYRRV